MPAARHAPARSCCATASCPTDTQATDDRAFEPLLVDEIVAEHYGDALARARGTGLIVKATDLLIIATAGATDRTLYTLDHAQAALARDLGLTVCGVA